MEAVAAQAAVAVLPLRRASHRSLVNNIGNRISRSVTTVAKPQAEARRSFG